MSSVNLNVNASVIDQLRTINTIAQSLKGSTTGRIGLINQLNGAPRVIKFNTHLGERLFGATKTVYMQASCDNLRNKLCDLLNQLVQKGQISTALCDKLTATINKGKSKKLLDRSIVADVIKNVETAVNETRTEKAKSISLDGDRNEMVRVSSSRRDTAFKTVREADTNLGRVNNSQMNGKEKVKLQFDKIEREDENPQEIRLKKKNYFGRTSVLSIEGEDEIGSKSNGRDFEDEEEYEVNGDYVFEEFNN